MFKSPVPSVPNETIDIAADTFIFLLTYLPYNIFKQKLYDGNSVYAYSGKLKTANERVEVFSSLTDKNYSSQIKPTFLAFLNGAGKEDSIKSHKWCVINQFLRGFSHYSKKYTVIKFLHENSDLLKLDIQTEKPLPVTTIYNAMINIVEHRNNDTVRRRFIAKLREKLAVVAAPEEESAYGANVLTFGIDDSYQPVTHKM